MKRRGGRGDHQLFLRIKYSGGGGVNGVAIARRQLNAKEKNRRGICLAN